MESAMPERHQRNGRRQLDPAQWDAIKRGAIRRAHDARAKALRRIVMSLTGPLRTGPLRRAFRHLRAGLRGWLPRLTAGRRLPGLSSL